MGWPVSSLIFLKKKRLNGTNINGDDAMAYMTRQEVMLLVVCGQLTQYWSTVQYATDLRLRGDVLAKSRVRCHLKKTVKCWAANWIREPNQRGRCQVGSTVFLKQKI
jgi:hypothetical protein